MTDPIKLQPAYEKEPPIGLVIDAGIKKFLKEMLYTAAATVITVSAVAYAIFQAIQRCSTQQKL